MDRIVFYHLADVHLGAWREKKLREINRLAFKKVMEEILRDDEVDFVLLSGDIFHVSHPEIEDLKLVVEYFKRLRDKGIRVYVVPGSHDYSVKEDSFIGVLEAAGLCINTVKARFSEDNKIVLLPTLDESGAVIYGMMGRRNGLEIEYYKDIVKLEGLDKYEDRFKIFQMHSGIEEYLPSYFKDVKALPLNLLPKGLNYYASGHIHYPSKIVWNNRIIVFPGPLFGSSVKEVELLKKGSFVKVSANRKDKEWEVNIDLKEVIIKDVIVDHLNLGTINVVNAKERIKEWGDKIKERGRDKIVLLTIEGEIVGGGSSDVGIKELKEKIEGEGGAYIVKINTSKLYSKEFEELKSQVEGKSIKEVEKEIKEMHLKDKEYNFNQYQIYDMLLEKLGMDRGEEESKEKYIKRVAFSSKHALLKALGIESRVGDE